MSELIDRMAQAFAGEIERQWQEGKPGPFIDTDYGMNDVVIDGRVDLVAAMRATLSAMLEPTEAMLAAVYRAGGKHAQYDVVPERMWPIMIDAALEKME